MPLALLRQVHCTFEKSFSLDICIEQDLLSHFLHIVCNALATFRQFFGAHKSHVPFIILTQFNGSFEILPGGYSGAHTTCFFGQNIFATEGYLLPDHVAFAARHPVQRVGRCIDGLKFGKFGIFKGAST